MQRFYTSNGLKSMASSASARAHFALIAILLAWLCTTCCLGQDNPPRFLQGGVEHSQQLEPVQSQLRVGGKFDQAKLDKIAPRRTWFKVPPWLAGKWQYDEYTQTFYEDYRGKDGRTYRKPAQGSETWASQRDRSGGLWRFFMVPTLTQVSTDRELFEDMHNYDSVISDSDAQVVLRSLTTRTVVDKATNTVSQVKQVEQFISFFPYSADMVRAEFSIKSFDYRGQPIDLTKGWKIGRRVAPFMLNNFDQNNQDVRPSFREFLVSNGMENLVPLEEPSTIYP